MKPLVRTGARWLLTVAMVAVGIAHFANPAPFVAIMPPFIPFHLAMVYLSGVFEIALGLALIPKQTRVLAGYGLVALYVAVFPANLYMAVAGISPTGEPIAPWIAWARLPLQPLLMLLAWWVGGDGATKPDAVSQSVSHLD
ncbi:MAG: DoxX family protein [Sandaracinaceae bacterium]|nr:DoxX family protein [Sandaracinaceae bacterium]